jgi:hypothetical protein
MAYNNDYPYSSMTQKMLDYLPSWMKIRMEKDERGNNPTVFAQFLNNFGLEFDSLDTLIKDSIDDFFVDTANLNLPSLLYLVNLDPILRDTQLARVIYYLKLPNQAEIEIGESASLKDFYTSTPSLIIDRDLNLGYINSQAVEIEYFKIKAFTLKEIAKDIFIKDLEIHHVWNAFDEIGLLLGLPRLKGETNISYKGRLTKVFSLKRGATKNEVKQNLSNLLGVSSDNINLHEFADLAFKGTLLDENGNPTEKMKAYVNLINKRLGNTWDNMRWGESYWKSIDEANMGLDYLPHVWDVRPRYCTTCKKYYDLNQSTCPVCGNETIGWDNSDFQSGIGDNLDLLVKAPVKENSTQDFNYYIKAHGSIPKDDYIYPEHTFTYKICAKGISTETGEGAVEDVKYTVLAGERYSFASGEIKVKASQTYEIEKTDIAFDQTSISQENSQNTIEIVPSNKIASPSDTGVNKNNYLKIVADLEDSGFTTPTLNSVTINWKDTSDVEHVLTLDTDLKLQGGTLESGDYPRTEATTANTDINNGVVLAKATFKATVNNQNEWLQGTTTDCKIENGRLTLS